MAAVLTVIAKVRAPNKDDAAFDLHRKAPHLAAYRERRKKEGLVAGPSEVEIYRSLTE
jgi:quinol monooxygenase YgiN